jgi:hypothetical protein
VAIIEAGDYYGRRFLSDLMLTSQYAAAEIIGKRSCFVHVAGSDTLALLDAGREHGQTDAVPVCAMLAARSVYEKAGFAGIELGANGGFGRQCQRQGFTVYSADRFNYLARVPAGRRRRTWPVADNGSLDRARKLARGLDLSRVEL